MLREELGHLERFNLRDIDYEGHFEATAAADGVEVLDLQSETELPLQAHTVPAQLQNGDLRSGNVEFGLSKPDSRQDLHAKVAGLTADDLGDDGVQIRQEQIPLWEAWVLGRRKGMSNRHLW